MILNLSYNHIRKLNLKRPSAVVVYSVSSALTKATQNFLRPTNNPGSINGIFEMGPRERFRMHKEVTAYRKEKEKQSRKESAKKYQSKWSSYSSFVAMGQQHFKEDAYFTVKIAFLMILMLYCWPKVIHSYLIPLLVDRNLLILLDQVDQVENEQAEFNFHTLKY